MIKKLAKKYRDRKEKRAIQKQVKERDSKITHWGRQPSSAAKTEAEVTMSMRVIRKNGEIEDHGEIPLDIQGGE